MPKVVKSAGKAAAVIGLAIAAITTAGVGGFALFSLLAGAPALAEVPSVSRRRGPGTSPVPSRSPVGIEFLMNFGGGTLLSRAAPRQVLADTFEKDTLYYRHARLPMHFVRRIRGDCMAPEICEGDLVMVSKTGTINEGDYCVVLAGPIAIVKRFIGIERGCLLMVEWTHPRLKQGGYDLEDVDGLYKVMRVIKSAGTLRGLSRYLKELFGAVFEARRLNKAAAILDEGARDPFG